MNTPNKQAETKYIWNIMCDKCHKIIGKEYTEDILNKVRQEGKAQALADEIKWLKENRDIIDGIDVLEVDKRLVKLQEEVYNIKNIHIPRS